jgi:hypothetical protein
MQGSEHLKTKLIESHRKRLGSDQPDLFQSGCRDFLYNSLQKTLCASASSLELQIRKVHQSASFMPRCRKVAP